MNASLLWTQDLATLGTARRVDNRNANQRELHERHTGLKKMGHDTGTLDDDLNFGRTIGIGDRPFAFWTGNGCTIGNLDSPTKSAKRNEASSGNVLHP